MLRLFLVVLVVLLGALAPAPGGSSVRAQEVGPGPCVVVDVPQWPGIVQFGLAPGYIVHWYVPAGEYLNDELRYGLAFPVHPDDFTGEQLPGTSVAYGVSAPTQYFWWLDEVLEGPELQSFTMTVCPPEPTPTPTPEPTASLTPAPLGPCYTASAQIVTLTAGATLPVASVVLPAQFNPVLSAGAVSASAPVINLFDFYGWWVQPFGSVIELQEDGSIVQFLGPGNFSRIDVHTTAGYFVTGTENGLVSLMLCEPATGPESNWPPGTGPFDCVDVLSQEVFIDENPWQIEAIVFPASAGGQYTDDSGSWSMARIWLFNANFTGWTFESLDGSFAVRGDGFSLAVDLGETETITLLTDYISVVSVAPFEMRMCPPTEATATPTASASPTVTRTPTATRTATQVTAVIPTRTPSATVTGTRTATPTATETATPTATGTPAPTGTGLPVPTFRPTSDTVATYVSIDDLLGGKEPFHTGGVMLSAGQTSVALLIEGADGDPCTDGVAVEFSAPFADAVDGGPFNPIHGPGLEQGICAVVQVTSPLNGFIRLITGGLLTIAFASYFLLTLRRLGDSAG